ncbi:MAG: SIMPL domain-containing protein [Sneathiella sp.]
MKKFVLATVAVLMLIPVTMASADNVQKNMNDQIILNVTKEGWVTTKSARVFVNFDITQQKETAAQLKNQIVESLQKLAPEPTWHITSSRESKDRTGLNRWSVTAEARVAENSISGLSDRAEQAGRPGFKMRISQVDFSPSLAETEKLRGELRTKIYVEAKAEADRLNAAIPGRSYRVWMVDFAQNNGYRRAAPVQMMAKSARMEMDSSASGYGSESQAAELAVSRRHSLSATVILTSDPSVKK